jgi:hypothetical protein
MGAGEIVQDLRHLLTPRVVIAALCRRMALSENHRDQGRLSSFYANVVCDLDRWIQHTGLSP